MKNLHKIFALILIIEIIFLTGSLFFQNNCASPCVEYSLIQPFGEKTGDFCTEVCVIKPYPATYLLGDLIILTILVYLSLILIKKIKS